MKVLQIIGSLETGGAEKLLLDTLPLYNKMGIEMDIVIFWNNNHPFTELLKRESVCKVIILNESKNKNDIYKFSNILKLRKLVKEYDVFHSHLFPAQYYSVLSILFKRRKPKLVFTEHNTENKRMKSALGRLFDSFSYKKYQFIIFISEEVENIFKRVYPIIKNSRIINNGVNLKSIRSAKPIDYRRIDSRVSLDHKIILQVSAFRPQKDQFTVIKALLSLPENYIAVFVGVGERLEACKEYSKDLGLEDRAFFLGQRMDVPQLLKSAQVIVLSSYYEGLSLSSIEGMASGVPFIASDVPGLRNIVKNYGILFERGNSDELAKEILKLENIDYRSEVVKFCVERASHYDIDDMVNIHVEVYKSLI